MTGLHSPYLDPAESLSGTGMMLQETGRRVGKEPQEPSPARHWHSAVEMAVRKRSAGFLH